MIILNTTTNKIVTIEVIDNNTNSDYSNDVVLNSDHDLMYNEITDTYEANDEICNWWINYCKKYEDAQNLLNEWTKTANSEQVDDLNSAIDVEFNDVPDAIINFIDNNKSAAI